MGNFAPKDQRRVAVMTSARARAGQSRASLRNARQNKDKRRTTHKLVLTFMIVKIIVRLYVFLIFIISVVLTYLNTF